MADPVPRLGIESPSVNAAPARRGMLAAVGAVGAGFLASLCCIGPVLFVTLGVGAGLASRFEPLRPLFTVLTLGLLAIGFYVVYGAPRPVAADGAACGPGESCATPRRRTRDKVVLWFAAAVALLLLTFPQWSKLLV